MPQDSHEVLVSESLNPQGHLESQTPYELHTFRIYPSTLSEAILLCYGSLSLDHAHHSQGITGTKKVLRIGHSQLPICPFCNRNNRL